MRQLTEGELWRYREMGILPDDYITPEPKPEAKPASKPPAKPPAQ